MCVCVHARVCVYVRERERGRETICGPKGDTLGGKSAPGADWMRAMVSEAACGQVQELPEAVRLGMDK